MLKLAACGLAAALALPAVAEAQDYGRHRDDYGRHDRYDRAYRRGHDRYGHGDRYDRGYGYVGGSVYVDSITEAEHEAYIRQGDYADGYSYGYGGVGYGYGGHGGYYGHGHSGGYAGHYNGYPIPYYGGHGQSWSRGYHAERWRYADSHGRRYSDGYRDEYGYNDDRPRSRRRHDDGGYYGREDCECGGVYLRDE